MGFCTVGKSYQSDGDVVSENIALDEEPSCAHTTKIDVIFIDKIKNQNLNKV